MTLTKVGRSKLAKARKSLTPAELFFYEHGGYSYSTDETPEQGHIRCAKSLADAEDKARNLGWVAQWTDDEDADLSWMDEETRNESHTVEGCILREAHPQGLMLGHILQSLWGITDADSNYRRVIEAELASEALVQYDSEIETLDAH